MTSLLRGVEITNAFSEMQGQHYIAFLAHDLFFKRCQNHQCISTSIASTLVQVIQTLTKASPQWLHYRLHFYVNRILKYKKSLSLESYLTFCMQN